MSKTYIFAVGGTGARVMRSLTMVLASGGNQIPKDMEIVPMIYDYDLNNGDKDRTVEVMDLYQKLHDTIYESSNAITLERSKGVFFGGKMSMIKDQDGENASVTKGQISTDSGFNVDMKTCIEKDRVVGNQSKYLTLKDYINYDQLDSSIQRFVDTLYTDEEKDMELNLGFRGRPNVGCVVIDKIAKLAEYRHFRIVFNENDRIVIVGSLFGGTGATCIPSLLRMLREDTRTQNAKIAVVAALPYFNVTDDPYSAIDSNTFPAKTKAAIDTYRGMVYNKANAIYFLGDNGSQGAFENHEGDKEQENKAALCELEGAFDILHFINLRDTDLQGYGNGTNDALAYENGYNAQEMPNPVMIEHFMGDNTHNNNLSPYVAALNRLLLFSKFNQKVYSTPNQFATANWYNNHLGNDVQLVIDFKKRLNEFASDLLLWIDELQGDGTPRKLKIFNQDIINCGDFLKMFEEPYNNLVKIEHRTLWSDRTVYVKVGRYGCDYKDINSVSEMLQKEFGSQDSVTKSYLNNANQVANDIDIPAFYTELSSIVWNEIYSAIITFSSQSNNKK